MRSAVWATLTASSALLLAAAAFGPAPDAAADTGPVVAPDDATAPGQIAEAGQATDERLANDAVGREPPRALSYGWPWRGLLANGRQVTDSDTIALVDTYRVDAHFFGTTELVRLLERAAADVARAHPGARLAVGELSGPRGGRIVRHRSHQNGRDVDLGFYLRNDDGGFVWPSTFIPIRGSGEGRVDGAVVRFDDAANWRLVAHLLEDPTVHVQHIFVSNRLRGRLLRYAHRVGASEGLIARASKIVRQPSRGNRHADHFHVRIYCSAEDHGRCRDRGPFWDWLPPESLPGHAEP
jgi:penicillin-insensitive murein endopeptidase